MKFIKVRGIWFNVKDLFMVTIIHEGDDYCVLGVYFDKKHGGGLYHTNSPEEAEAFLTELITKLNAED